MVVILTTGAIFVMWLGEQITERGIGNGMSLLITFSILERIWPGICTTGPASSRTRRGRRVSGVAVLRWRSWSRWSPRVVAMTIAARRIPIQIPQQGRWARGRIREGQKTFIPLRLITAGVMPIIFAQSIIIVPGTIAQLHQEPGAAATSPASSARATLPYDLTFAVLILLFTYFYTSIIFNPVDLAENLKKQGGFIPGVKPGAKHGRLHRRRAGADHAAGRALPRRHRAPADPGLARRSNVPFQGSAAPRC